MFFSPSVSPVAHTDVHPVEVMRSYRTSREELEIPRLNDAIDSLLDGVEHNHVNIICGSPFYSCVNKEAEAAP